MPKKTIPWNKFLLVESNEQNIISNTDIARLDLNLTPNNNKLLAQISGNIKSTLGLIISNANLTLLLSKDNSIVATTTSDSNGYYSFNNIDPTKQYTVSVTALFYFWSTSDVINLMPLQNFDQDFTLIDLWVIISGIILNLDSTPAKADLYLYNIKDPLHPILIKYTKTGLDGRYVFPPVTIGSYKIVAISDDFDDIFKIFDIDGSSKPNINFDLKFEKPKDAQIIGTVSNSSIIPISGATVILKTSGFNITVGTTITDLFGNYSFTKLSTSISYYLTVTAKNFIPQTSNTITLSPMQILKKDFNLTDLLGSIIGSLLDDAYNPTIGTLLLYGSSSSGVAIATTTSDATGNFIFNNITAGSYSIKAQSSLYSDVSTSFSYTDATTPLTLQIKFSQKKTAKINGIIKNSAGNALSSATVTLKSAGFNLTLGTFTTDATGNYNFIDLNTSISYYITVSAKNFISQISNTITLTPLQTLQKDFTLNDLLGAITGSLTDNLFNPVSGNVLLYNSSSSTTPIATVNSDASGNFTINNTPAGNYSIKAQSPYFNDVSTNVSYTDATTPLYVQIKFITQKTAQINGIIKNSAGTAISSATINLKNSSSNSIVATTTSDTSGNYSFTSLNATNSYYITVTAKNFISQISNNITLTPLQTLQKDFTLSDLLGAITGSITDTLFNPVSASLFLYDSSSNSTAIATIISDSNGNFTFNNVSSGNYSIKAQSLYYNDVSTSVSYADASTPLSVQIKFTTQKTAQINGIIKNSVGTVISAATVTLKNASSNATIATATSDASGNYSFTNISPTNSYYITVTAKNFISQISNNITLTPLQTLQKDFTLIDLLGSITGSITDTLFNPVSGNILLYNSSSNTTPIVTVASDASGNFTLNNIAVGNYSITAQSPYYNDVSTNVSYTDATTPLNVQIKFTTQKTAQINGIIKNSAGIGISNATITLKNSSSNTTIATTASTVSGNYNFTNINAAKSYYITVTAKNFISQISNTITLTPLQTLQKDFTLNDLLGSILGSLLDTSSNPISGNLLLYNSSSNTTPIATTTSDASGNFTFSNTPAGSYSIKAQSPYYNDVSTNVSYTDATAPLNVQIKFTTQKTAQINGIIKNSAGTAISNASITLKNSSSNATVATTTSNASGNYSFTNISPSISYVINVTAQNFVSQNSNTITLSPLQVLQKDFTLIDLLGSIVGTLLDTSSNPVIGDLSLYNSSSNTTPIATTTSDTSGNFTFSNLSVGSYSITAQALLYKDISTSVSYTNTSTSLNVQIKFTAQKTAQINGTVLDSKNVAIVNATINLINKLSLVTISTTNSDTNGNYLFNTVTISTLYLISVSSTQYITSTSNVNVDLPTNYKLDFKLNDLLGSITGTTFDTASNPTPSNLSLYNSSSNTTPIKTTSSGSDGKFSFINVPRDSYTIKAQSPIHKDISTSVSYTDATTPLNVNISFTQKSVITVQGNVTNTKNQAIQGATITIKASSDLSTITTSNTDSSGNYSINNISIAKGIIIYADKNLYSQKASSSFTSVNGYTLTQNFVLSTPSGTITGKILDNTSSSPVGNVNVILYSYQISINFGTNIANVYTDNSGNYVFTNVAVNQAGYDYFVSTYVAGYNNYWSSHFTLSDTTIPLVVNDIRLTLKLKTIICYFKDKSNVTISNATLVLKSYPNLNVIGNLPYEPLVSNYGIGDLNPGDYIIVATTPNFPTVTSSVISIKFTDTLISIDLVLPGSGSISGKVSSPDSYGILGATVSLYYSSNSSLITKITTNNWGSFTFGSLPANDYFLGASATGFVTSYTGKITVNENAITYNLTLANLGSINGKVTDKSSGAALANAGVYLHYSSDSSLAAQTNTDSSGNYYFGSLAPNDYFIGVALANYDDAYTDKITINNNSVTSNITMSLSQYAPHFYNLIVSTPTTYNSLNYKAIWGEFHNGAIINFGGNFVDYLGGFSGGYIVLYINAPTSARYAITVSYLAGDYARQLKVKVTNPSVSYNYTVGILAKTNSWNPSDAQVGVVGSIDLAQGVNTVMFYNDTASYAPALNDIKFSYSPPTMVASVPNGQLFNGAYNQWIEYWGRSVRFTLAIGGSNYGYVLMDYNFPDGGKYNFSFYYLSAGGDKPLSIDTPSGSKTVWFPATNGSWLTDAKYYDVTISSPPGNKTIKFYGSGTNSAPALSYIYVSFIPFLRTISASQFSVTGSAYLNQYSFIQGISSKSGSMYTYVDVDAPGYYELTINYVDTVSGRKIRIKINGVDTGKYYDLPPTSNWSSLNSITVKLYLDNWTNKIEFYL